MGEQACLDALVANTLTSFEDDGVTKVGASCLRYHTALTDVTLPQCKSVESYGLASCTALTTVDMQGTGTIAASAFNGDSALTHLLLRGGSKTTLANTSAFSYTPISLGSGAVYVPSNLLATYKADAGWKNYFITTLDKYPLTDFSTIEDDWATIISKAEAGTASESYSIGDTKLVDLGTEGKVYAQIAAFGVDPLASDGTKTAGITFVTKNLLATMKVMNTTATTNGGWSASAMRSYLANTILPLFPSTVKDAIKEVTKYSDVYENSGIVHDNTTIDKLWIPSAREVFGAMYEQTGPTYIGLFNAGCIKYDGAGSSSTWWLRSAASSSTYRRVQTSGTIGTGSAASTSNIALGFCI